MQMNFSMASDMALEPTNIKVVGIGGGGGNAVNRMIRSGMRNVEFIAMNTDSQALATSLADKKLNIGMRLTKGFGAGGDALVGQRAAEESRDEIQSCLKGADMVFITAGMGGGTGTGAAPVVAEIARSMGILTVAVVTKPFGFENRRRMRTAEMGITSLRDKIDALIVVPNDRLQYISTERITLANAFAAADSVLCQGVQSIADIISGSGYINLDFADVTSVMKNAGNAHMGVGRASGRDKAEQAALAAVNSPLLETSIYGAKGVIVSITAPADALLDDISHTSEVIAEMVHEDANLIWGFSYDDNLDDELIVTVIATGFADEQTKKYVEDIMSYPMKEGAAAQPVQEQPDPEPQPESAPEPETHQPENAVMAQLEEEQPTEEENTENGEDSDWLEPLDFGKADKQKQREEPKPEEKPEEDWLKSLGYTPKTWDDDKDEEWPDLETIRPLNAAKKAERDYDDYDIEDNSGGFFKKLFGGGSNQKNQKKKKKR